MYIVIFVTAANKKEASNIAKKLIAAKLAACVNIIDKIDSLFRWQGKLDQAKESFLIIKSRDTKFKQIAKMVKSLHSYEVPEIIALPIVCGDAAYLEWINESVG
ncbi:MAG: divalent-cation tolerance protein CutA [Candidatus Omnitrophica bacterium]|nr:divalent-cation tolerance protein CutA [Candidatus Omnitrophota bacterium]